VREHLAPDGLFYFNTTHSPHAQKTAVTVFPHAWRVGGFVAASDAPIAFDRARWEAFLTSFRLDGRPLLDATAARDRPVLDALLATADEIDGPRLTTDFETRRHMVDRLSAVDAVTDDNMLVEWR
jgi:hypothetical protein